MENNCLRTEEKALQYSKLSGLLQSGDRIIAGVSGGADSLCMLVLLMKWKECLKLELRVVHINHGIRGKSAEEDAEYVRAFCGENGIPYECVCGDIPRLAAETGTTCEEAGRNFRYETFTRIAAAEGFNKIAVAHNSDDNAETVLFNIFRGSGIAGVRGIPPMRSMNVAGPECEHTVSLIRPVLCLTRREIEGYLSERKINWRTDETNLTDDYSRNIVRNHILPTAVTLNANAAGHIGELSTQAAELEDFVGQLADRELQRCSFVCASDDETVTECEIPDSVTDSLHPVIIKALLRRCFCLLSKSLKDVGSVHINEIMALRGGTTGKKADLPYSLEAVRTYSGIALRKKNREREIPDGTAAIELRIMENGFPEESIPENDCIQWFDYDKLNGSPVVRQPAGGDYILIGKEQRRKHLNRVFIDAKIPADKRGTMTVLAVGSHVLWIPGVRRDDSCYVTAETRRILAAAVTENVKIY